MTWWQLLLLLLLVFWVLMRDLFSILGNILTAIMVLVIIFLAPLFLAFRFWRWLDARTERDRDWHEDGWD